MYIIVAIQDNNRKSILTIAICGSSDRTKRHHTLDARNYRIIPPKTNSQQNTVLITSTAYISHIYRPALATTCTMYFLKKTPRAYTTQPRSNFTRSLGLVRRKITRAKNIRVHPREKRTKRKEKNRLRACLRRRERNTSGDQRAAREDAWAC